MATKSKDKGGATADDSAAHGSSPTIVGGYAITCEEISSNWPDDVEELTLSIAELLNSPGVYQGSFEFGIAEGVLLLSNDEALLDERVALFAEEEERDRYDEEEYDDEDDEELDDEDADVNSASKTQPGLNSGKPDATQAQVVPKDKESEAAKAVPNSKFHLLSRGQENGEGETYYTPCPGHIDFTDDTYTRFTGTMDICFIGRVDIVGERVSDVGGGGDWNTYTEAAYEEARVGRWR